MPLGSRHAEERLTGTPARVLEFDRGDSETVIGRITSTTVRSLTEKAMLPDTR
jgi:hypothetical protein